MIDIDAVAEAVAQAERNSRHLSVKRDVYRRMAQAAVDALQFTEEKRTLTDGWVQPTRNAWYYAQGLTPPPAVITHQSRLVGKWVEEQQR